MVIVGAGFGGINAARALRRAPVDIVLIDRNNHHLFQPLLYQVATAALAATDIASPIRAMFSNQANVQVLLGEAEGVDLAAQAVNVKGVGPIRYDYLILATGAQSSWFGHADWAEHSVGLKSLLDAEALRMRLLGAFEWAEGQTDAAEIKRLLTFVVVGGGATGVELAGAIRELARHSLAREYRRIRADQARVVLFEGSPTILAGFPERLVRYARTRLERLGVEVRTGVQVEAVDAQGVIAGGERLSSANVFWCAGVAATPAAHWLNIHPARHGALPVGPDCSVASHPAIFAIGDVAAFTGPDGSLPGVASVAKQQGRYVGRLIAAKLGGTAAPPPFRYHDQGSLAIVGRAAAVARFPWGQLTGLPAWLLWSGVHLVLLNGLRNRVLVYIQWVSAWLSHGRGALLMIAGAGRAGQLLSDVDAIQRKPPHQG